MPENSPSNVKIYDRPERKGPPPIALAIALVVVLIVGFLLYKLFYHPNTPAVKPQVGFVTLLKVTADLPAQSAAHISRL